MAGRRSDAASPNMTEDSDVDVQEGRQQADRERPQTRNSVRDRPGRERAILDAARTLFARLGYERTTMRAVGRAAGVDPSLIAAYFGNKDGLFAAVAAAPQSLIDALQGPATELGRRLV